MIVKIALLGCGTVASGFLELLKQQSNYLNTKLGLDCVIESILVRSPKNYMGHPHESAMTTDFNVVLERKPDLVIELMGGIEPARSYILEAMAQGCHIITANKDLLAVHGYELFQQANLCNVSLGFEGSVGGGIPVINPLKDTLRFGGIHRIEGIVNGTCNYILSRMSEANLSYQLALSEATLNGFAESNPHSDVSGLDSARKLCVLSSLAFDKCLVPDLVLTTGIENITQENIQLAKVNGMRFKLIALSISVDNKLYSAVQPCLIGEGHPFYNVNNEYNGILFSSNSVGTTLLSGKGAGKMPTGSAVFGDFIDYCNGKSDKSVAYSANASYESLRFNPEPSRWILQICNPLSADELGRILQTFSDHKLHIYQSPEGCGVQLAIENLLESELYERLSLIAEWCPNVQLTPYLYLS
jgi:homoserine dehydrogenase